MGSYQAIITPIVNIRPHTNADRLNLGTAAGFQVIVSKDIKEGTLGVFFQEGGQLSREMCYHNNLHHHSELNKDPDGKPGFFDDNRRVRAQRLRGEASMGFWTELDTLDWTGVDGATLKRNTLFDTLGDFLICNKYITPATLRAMGASKGRLSKKLQLKNAYPHFYEHWDTKQLRMLAGSIPSGAVLSITEKVHGTSARTGRLIEVQPLNWFQKKWNSIFRCKFSAEEYRYVSGTWRVVIDPSLSEERGYYSGKQFRNAIHHTIKDAGLRMGETVYYEIVGYAEDGSRIMGAHDIKDKALKKRYGNKMVYKYGCDSGQYKVFVYRITQVTPNGVVVELPWHQVISRSKELGWDYVPQLKDPFIYDGDTDALLSLCESLSHGHSVLDEEHIKEGVVVRVEAPNMDIHLKFKGYWFCELEGIKKNNPEYVDPEELEDAVSD